MVRSVTKRLRHILVSASVWLPTVVFAIWFNVYYWLLEGGRYQAYLQPGMWPLLILAMGILAAFLAALIALTTRATSHTGNGGHWINAAILSVPALFLWLFYGQGLGADALSRKAFDLQHLTSPGKSMPDRFLRLDVGDGSIDFIDLLTSPETFKDRPVTVTGSVYRNPAMPADKFLLFRFLVLCCAADALPIGINVSGAGPESLKNDDWVRVSGRVHIDSDNGRPMPEIVAERIETLPAPPPQKRYLYYGR